MKGYISFNARLLMGFGALMLLMIFLIGMALQQFSNAQAGMMKLRDVVSPQAWAAEKMALDIIQVQQFLTDVSATQDPEGYQDAETFANDFKETIQVQRENKLSAAQMAELDAIEQAFEEFYRLGKRMAEAYISSGTKAGNVLMEDFDKTSLILAGRMTKFRDVAVDHEKSITSTLAKTAHDALNFMLIIGGIALGVGLLISWYLTRHLAKQLGIDPFYAKGIAIEIAKGNLSRNIEVPANDKSSLLYAMQRMQEQILERVTAANKLIEDVTRIKIALDNVSTGVMIADNERNIIYANKAVVGLLTKVEADIRTELPNFSVSKLVGNNIDLFHKNPTHQANILSSAKESFKSDLVLHGHHFVITVNPVVDEEGRHLGTAAEWLDRTAEVTVEKEVSSIVAAAIRGDFSKRFDLQNKTGFFRELSESLNRFFQTSETGLNDVVRVLSAMAQGDLTETINAEYAGTFGLLKDNTNTTTVKLKEIISRIRDASDNINANAKEIASGNNDLSHRTEEQAASLEQTAASMQELTATVQHNTANAKRANDLAINAAEIAGKGGSVVHQVVVTMEEINESSRKIVDIISVIDGIAFQTNILALNAAVEAARAGEQGRGFAVVAVEVRNLAQRAAAAAGEIKNLISDSVYKVEEGSKLVDRAGKTMAEIVSSIKGVNAMMAEITRASEEQGTGIEQVNQAIGQMDTVTQQNAALVEEATAAAESLEEQAQDLAVIVGSFKVDGKPRRISGPLSTAPHAKESSLPRAVKGNIPVPKLVDVSADEWEEF
ncbi:MAG: methyl-accepting chemotaxis protein [Methylobacter sp.]|nr:MAG: methyl-accepting chemotaxis protein [Methylobacter sp.]